MVLINAVYGYYRGNESSSTLSYSCQIGSRITLFFHKKGNNFFKKAITDPVSSYSNIVRLVLISMNVSITDDDWKILEQKIRVFHEHVKSFQREVEERLG
jgi:predicted sugar kinase